MKFLAFFALLAVASAAPTEQAAPSDHFLLNVVGDILANLKLNPVEVGPAIVEPIAVGPAVVDNFEPIAVGPAVVDSFEPIAVGPAIVDNYQHIAVGPAIVDNYQPIVVGPAVVDHFEPSPVAVVDSIVPTPVAVVDSSISASPAAEAYPIVFHIKNVIVARDISGSPVTITGRRVTDIKHSPMVVAEPIDPTPVTVVEGEIAPSPNVDVDTIDPTPVAVVDSPISASPAAEAPALPYPFDGSHPMVFHINNVIVARDISGSSVTVTGRRVTDIKHSSMVVGEPIDPTPVAVIDSPISASPAAEAPALPYPFDDSHPMVFHINNVIVARDISGSPVTVTGRRVTDIKHSSMVVGEPIDPTPVAVIDSPISASPAAEAPALPYPFDGSYPNMDFHIKNLLVAGDISGRPVTITRQPNKLSPVVVTEPIDPTPVAVEEIVPEPVVIGILPEELN